MKNIKQAEQTSKQKGNANIQNYHRFETKLQLKMVFNKTIGEYGHKTNNKHNHQQQTQQKLKKQNNKLVIATIHNNP